MSLTFSNILDTDVGLDLAQRFPPVERLFDQRTPVILYPAGRMAGKAAVELQKLGVNVIGFGDGNSTRWGTSMMGMPVFSPQQIVTQYATASVLVASSMYDSEITGQFKALGCKWVYPMPFLARCLPTIFVSREYEGAFDAVGNPANHEAINRAYGLLVDDESRRTFASKLEYLVTLDKQRLDQIRSRQPIYFDPDVAPLSPQEVVADGGAYTGDTLRQFLRITGGVFSAYHAFEPDPKNFAALQQVAAADPQRIFPMCLGLADSSGERCFISTSGADARIVNDGRAGSECLSVISLDDYFMNRQPPTFIKTDIEGFEAPALQGAAQLIARHQPVLAVSAYHYASDLWAIPNLIHELNPGYALLIRHYTREIDDTVCYAVPQGRVMP